MDNFNLRKYLAEGQTNKMVKENLQEDSKYTIDLNNIKADNIWMLASHVKDATLGKTGPISDLLSQAADMLEDQEEN
mgnify:CR=1 FL=1|tara:strand:- start:57 stop:287 length:231 start_codon:yes stop_codon:yes gene_type:complete